MIAKPVQSPIRRMAISNSKAAVSAGSHSSCDDLTNGQPAKVQPEQGSSRETPRSLALRLIDDFLFITPSATAARALVARLQAGPYLPCVS